MVSLVALLLVCGACGGSTGTGSRAAATSPGHLRPTGVASGGRVGASSASSRGHVRATSATSNAVRPVDPRTFTPGACVAYPPIGPARDLTVFLDAGHGGRDPGAVGRTKSGHTVYEADQSLAVELDATAILRAAGFRVVVSRTHDTSVLRLGPDDLSRGLLTVDGSHEDVLARDVCANDAHANVLVGIYFNAGAPYNAGMVTGYDAVRPFAAANLRLANLLQRDVLAAMNAHGWSIPDLGVHSDVGLGSVLSSQGLAYGHLVLLGPASHGYVPTPSRMPGALIEPLYITDPFEGSLAASHHGQEVIAGALAKAIGQYLVHGA